MALHAGRPSRWKLIEPRRPILSVSPARAVAVGSPTTQWSMRLAARFQPGQHFGGAVDGGAFLVAGDEQADRAFGRAIRQHAPAAATKAAMADFMSAAPRPYSMPSSIVGGEGIVPPSLSPGGTTSLWPAKQKCGAAVPSRA